MFLWKSVRGSFRRPAARSEGSRRLSLERLEDLTSLPLLEKSDIRRDVEAFKSDTARRLMRFNTGGSSGEPLRRRQR